MNTKQKVLLLLLLQCTCCLAQKTTLEKIEHPNVSKYKSFTAELETKKKYISPTHFNYIQVIDTRADKSKIGITKAGEKPEDRRIILPKDFTPYLQEKVNKMSDRNGDTSDTAIF